jgi:predicted Zn-dependent peptidase
LQTLIEYKKHDLANGLTLIHHEDKDTTLAVINILYKVGARNEDPDRTGFAHLFEHLMFGGSENIPEYDSPLQLAGGENNAFTNNDITNYYLTLPEQNIETGFWLESDRMLKLAFNPESLEVQRKVVIEEFKQRYLNQPYGDVWLKLRPLAYKVHPYKWATIGKDISHIEQATLADVEDFFYKYYAPDNAIMVVAGNISFEKTLNLTNKWFGNIPNRGVKLQPLPSEPQQLEDRFETVTADVPANALYKAWHMCNRLDEDYIVTDLISDILSGGNSGRIYNQLVKEEQLFLSLHAYISGDVDAGLFVVEGRLNNGITIEQAEAGIVVELEKICAELVSERELEKVKNKAISVAAFAETNILNKAMSLAYMEMLGDANRVNTEIELYKKVTREDILRVSNTIFKLGACSTLYYLSSAK